MEKNPKINVVIVSWNVAQSLKRCLESVFTAKYPDLEVFVIDNASTDDSVKIAKSFPGVKVVANFNNIGFPKAINIGLRQSRGDYILLLNPDTRIPKDFFVKALDFARSHPDMGVMGPKFTDPDGTPQGVDREFVVNFSVLDENASLHLDRNIAEYTEVTDPDAIEALKADGDFGESNLMHSINGYVYGNQPGFEMKQGENVRIYAMAMGTEVDLHTPHTHGNTFLNMGMRQDVVGLLPAQMLTLDMTPDNPGTWFFHCHVNDHITAGMSTLYTVKPL